MPTVASVDYPAKRIYLSADTVGVPLDLLDVYRDVRALRRATPAHQVHRPMVVAGGNLQKTETTYTQPYVQLLYGCRIVPYPAHQLLRVIREVFTDDGAYGAECFDRSTVSGLVDIDIDMQIAPVEVREINVAGGSGLTSTQAAQLAAIAALLPQVKTDTGLIPALL